MQHRVRVQVLVLTEAAPERRLDRDTGRAVPHPAEPDVGRVAQAEVVRAAVFTVTAGEVLLDHHAIARLNAPARLRQRSELGNAPDVFVTQDLGVARALIRGPIAPAHA